MVDEVIKQWIRQVERTGELRRDPRYGKPLVIGEDYLETPEELRMGYKILKDAGYVPAEVEMLKRLAERKTALAREVDPKRRRALEREVAELAQKASMMLERLESKG